MNTVTLREYLLDKPSATEDFPFGPEVAVFKVGGKIFALMPTDAAPLTVSLKCDPNDALALPAMYPDAVQLGYHLSKMLLQEYSHAIGHHAPDGISRHRFSRVNIDGLCRCRMEG